MRDLLLKRPVRDVDLVVVGDARRFVSGLSRKLGRPARTHERFGTATIVLADGESIDVSAARRELYERPGALPRVEASDSIEEDLFRRDFTIHAMALEIAPARGSAARLLDPFGGRRDLARRRLAILHPRSFQDDPTRALRAARYANRLGLTLEARSRRALRQALREDVLDCVSGQRIRRELELIFSEESWPGALRWLAKLGLARRIHPALGTSAAAMARVRELERLARGQGESRRWLAALLVWVTGVSVERLLDLADRLALAGEDRRILLTWPETLADLRRATARRPPRLPGDLRIAPVQRLAALAAVRPASRKALRRALASHAVTLRIGGKDLLASGLPAGPVMGRALAETLAARRAGMISRRQELEFALKIARKLHS